MAPTTRAQEESANDNSVKSEPNFRVKEGESSNKSMSRRDNHSGSGGEKRKSAPTSASSYEPPLKALKSDLEASSQAKVAMPPQIVKFLLSPEALELCRNPKSEPGAAGSSSCGSRVEKVEGDNKGEAKGGKYGKDYFSEDLTPFEHVIYAVSLSRPIGHVLGQRTIKTVFNEPWN
jgi:hypothetical protein